MGTSPATRLYASSIAIVSGIYAIGSSASALGRTPMMSEMDAGVGLGTWIMLAVGIVVLVHGVVLLTPLAMRLRRSSGPAMVLWALIMLVNQGLLAAMPGWGMGGMGANAGMVAIAALMLASGLIMSRDPTSDATG